MSKIGSFFKESRQELAKVIWPTKEEVLTSTKVVVISVIIFALGLGLVDFVLLKLLYLLF
ncbi:MAG: preprotein translocase subunit SecE [Spirochaetia bacterium]|jgi:preprotein translocase subunit SecE|nr:preprotein translocase subunit SecE [Spirochaetia bacterium]